MAAEASAARADRPAAQGSRGEAPRAWCRHRVSVGRAGVCLEALGDSRDAHADLALGSGGAPRADSWPIARATDRSTGRACGLSRGQPCDGTLAVAPFAESAERDKGWLGVGALADLAVLSDDVFTVPADRVPAITSVLTVLGGAIVYDPGILSPRP